VEGLDWIGAMNLMIQRKLHDKKSFTLTINICANIIIYHHPHQLNHQHPHQFNHYHHRQLNHHHYHYHQITL
jgi:hypothetical protein